MFDFINRKREFQTLQESFLEHVLRYHGCLSYLIQGRQGAGKTRLIHEFIDSIESDKRLASQIPKFRRRIHVIEYECKKELSTPYQAFVEISKQIQEQQQTFRILKQLGMLAIAFLPIHDIIEDFLKLGNAINSGETEEAIRAKETRLFTKYLRTLKSRSERVPLIIFLKNVQWIDDYSLELLHTLIDTDKSMWGMIILEYDDVGSANPNLNSILNRLIEKQRLFRLTLRSMQKGFEIDMLESRFGAQLFTTTEFEHIYTISEGSPGILAVLAEDWIRKGWIKQEGDQWSKIEGFENKIKAPHQKLLDLLITLLQDGVISPRERILINNFAEEWGIGADVVSRMTDMLLKAQQLGYTVDRRVHSGAISKDAFLAYDKNMNRFLVEYVSDIEDFKREIVPREVKHPHLLGTRDIKLFQNGALIISDYLEGKTLKEVKIEEYDSHIKNTLKTAAQIAEGLAELHRNNLVHGHLRPEAIIVAKEGDVRLTGLDAMQFKRSDYSDDMDTYTLSYCSPEHITQEKLDTRSDIFSFGILLYEMLTGELPFQGKSRGELKQAIRFDPIPPFEHLKARIPLDVQNLILTCLQKDPERRYQNAGQLLRHLEELLFRTKEFDHKAKDRTLDKEKASHTPLLSSRKKRLLIPAFASVVSLTAVLLLLYFFVYKDKQSLDVIDTVIIKDLNIEQTTEEAGRLTPDMLKYLIVDDLMQSSDLVVLEEEEFNYLYTSKSVPRLLINGAIQFKGVGYNISIDMQHEDGRHEKNTLDFVDPSALLTSEVSDLTSHILAILDIAEKKKSTFTTSWDAFESFYRGEKAWNLLEPTVAEQHYTQALDIDPEFVLAKLRLAGVLQFRGSTTRAQQLVQSIQPRLGELSYVDSLKAEALTARLTGELRREIDLLRTIYNRFPTRKEAPYEVAEAYYAICDIKNAIDFYKKVLDLDKEFARAHNHLAYCYSHLGEHSLALEHFKKYVELDSTANAFDSLGDGYFAAGLLDSAVWAKEQGIRLDPKLTYLYGTLCYIKLRQGQFQQAQKLAKDYIALSPEQQGQASGYFRLALVEYSRRHFQTALDLALQGKNIFDSKNIVTRDHGLHWLLGLLYLKSDRLDEARRELTEMQALIDSNHVTATNYRRGIYKYAAHLRACLAARQGDLNDVLDVLKEFDGPIKDKIKDHGSPFDLSFFNTHFGELLMAPPFNRHQLSRERLLKALEYNSNYAMAHYYLWQLSRQTGADDAGQQALNRIQELWRNADPEARKIYGIPNETAG
ncbi:hypothetical protein EH223_08980 [candidate division KSB1 bacterium]|nr:protein kinase [candidate division KSB1 bacterium]RQW03740.1 MAG: hypothetical protein EH223_08980 [candidate division KSB1 bacterium]